jgi:hypothetical protein
MSQLRALDAGQKSPPARSADLDWLAGAWQGPAFNGQADEIWSAPQAGSLVGMYRLVVGGQVKFYELMAIEEAEGSLVLRIKHFNPGLQGWEEKDRAVEFPLVALEPGAAYFDGLTFRRISEDALDVHLRVGAPDGSTQEYVFHYRRTPLTPPAAG